LATFKPQKTASASAIPSKTRSAQSQMPNTPASPFTEPGDLYLYTDNPPLQAYVDRSDMGHGLLHISTVVQLIGKNQECDSIKIDDESNLIFAASNAEKETFDTAALPWEALYQVVSALISTPFASRHLWLFESRLASDLRKMPVGLAYG
jgi:hypothetical protein